MSGTLNDTDRRYLEMAVKLSRGYAEVLALRAAGQALGTHQFENATLYSSSEPCPMCLAACYWARLDRVVFAATTRDVAANGLSDLAVYEQLRLPAESATAVQL